MPFQIPARQSSHHRGKKRPDELLVPSIKSALFPSRVSTAKQAVPPSETNNMSAQHQSSIPSAKCVCLSYIWNPHTPASLPGVRQTSCLCHQKLLGCSQYEPCTAHLVYLTDPPSVRLANKYRKACKACVDFQEERTPSQAQLQRRARHNDSFITLLGPVRAPTGHKPIQNRNTIPGCRRALSMHADQLAPGMKRTGGQVASQPVQNAQPSLNCKRFSGKLRPRKG
jgi:hypothetical protein